MTRVLFAATALSLAFAAPAMAGDKPARTFTRDGVTYTYTSTKTADATILQGRAYPVGGNFRLTVKNGKVSGKVGSGNVAFSLKSVDRAKGLAMK